MFELVRFGLSDGHEKLLQAASNFATEIFSAQLDPERREDRFVILSLRSDRIRTCGIVLPNAKASVFCLILRAFPCFFVQNPCFFVPQSPSFPRSPDL